MRTVFKKNTASLAKIALIDAVMKGLHYEGRAVEYLLEYESILSKRIIPVYYPSTAITERNQ